MGITPEHLDYLRRNSKVRLDREGRWSMDDRPVEHPRVQRLFHRGLSVEDGRPVLRVGTQWCYVQFVDDTAFFVERVRREGDVLVARLMDETEEPLPLETLSRSGETDIYCRLSGGRRARLLRDAALALAPFLVERNSEWGVEFGSRFYPISEEPTSESSE